MWTRLAILGGAGVVGFPWLGLLLYESVPASAFSAMPGGAKVAFLAVAVTLQVATAASALFSFLMMLNGDRR